MISGFLSMLAPLVPAAGKIPGQTPPDLRGEWRGTSICQIKDSPCHDEQALYHFRPGTGKGKYQVQMNKIVDGREIEMGSLEFSWEEKEHKISAINPANGSRWDLLISGEEMSGTLLYKGQIYRRIHIRKDP
jgi:hypothetical protein